MWERTLVKGSLGREVRKVEKIGGERWQHAQSTGRRRGSTGRNLAPKKNKKGNEEGRRRSRIRDGVCNIIFIYDGNNFFYVRLEHYFPSKHY